MRLNHKGLHKVLQHSRANKKELCSCDLIAYARARNCMRPSYRYYMAFYKQSLNNNIRWCSHSGAIVLSTIFNRTDVAPKIDVCNNTSVNGSNCFKSAPRWGIRYKVDCCSGYRYKTPNKLLILSRVTTQCGYLLKIFLQQCGALKIIVKNRPRKYYTMILSSKETTKNWLYNDQ